MVVRLVQERHDDTPDPRHCPIQVNKYQVTKHSTQSARVQDNEEIQDTQFKWASTLQRDPKPYNHATDT